MAAHAEVTAPREQIFAIWSRISPRRLTRRQTEAFFGHPAMPSLTRSLRLIGAAELERSARDLAAKEPFTLELWAWVARRRVSEVRRRSIHRRARPVAR